MCSLFLAAYLSAGIGITDHPAWRELWGSPIGHVRYEQDIAKCGEVTLGIDLNHVSSIETNRDRGLNYGLVSVKAKIW